MQTSPNEIGYILLGLVVFLPVAFCIITYTAYKNKTDTPPETYKAFMERLAKEDESYLESRCKADLDEDVQRRLEEAFAPRTQAPTSRVGAYRPNPASIGEFTAEHVMKPSQWEPEIKLHNMRLTNYDSCVKVALYDTIKKNAPITVLFSVLGYDSYLSKKFSTFNEFADSKLYRLLYRPYLSLGGGRQMLTSISSFDDLDKDQKDDLAAELDAFKEIDKRNKEASARKSELKRKEQEKLESEIFNELL